jgi:hypothetical protein
MLPYNIYALFIRKHSFRFVIEINAVVRKKLGYNVGATRELCVGWNVNGPIFELHGIKFSSWVRVSTFL